MFHATSGREDFAPVITQFPVSATIKLPDRQLDLQFPSETTVAKIKQLIQKEIGEEEAKNPLDEMSIEDLKKEVLNLRAQLAKKSKPPTPKEWACKFCTLINPPSATRCEVCSNAKTEKDN